jgi:hypothetical protein
MRICWILFLASLLLIACSSGGGEQDGGLDDAFDAGGDDAGTNGDDAGAGGDDAGIGGDDAGITGDDGGPGDEGGSDIGPKPDYDPAESFLVIVPAGTGLCSTFCECRGWREEYQMLGRIDLREGQYVLPRQAGSFPLDWIDRAWFRPERNQLTPAGPGEVLATWHDMGLWYYQFSQAFFGEGKSFTVTVDISFYSSDDTWPEETVLDESTMMGFVGGGILFGPDWRTEQQALGPCQLSEGWRRIITAAVAGGDRVVMDVRGSMPCMLSGNTTCYYFTSAEVTLGGGQLTVDEHFQLVYSAGHHNEGEEFLIVLDSPVGQTAALLVIAPPMLTPDGGELVYLDSNLAELSREPLSEWQSTF